MNKSSNNSSWSKNDSDSDDRCAESPSGKHVWVESSDWNDYVGTDSSGNNVFRERCLHCDKEA